MVHFNSYSLSKQVSTTLLCIHGQGEEEEGKRATGLLIWVKLSVHLPGDKALKQLQHTAGTSAVMFLWNKMNAVTETQLLSAPFINPTHECML